MPSHTDTERRKRKASKRVRSTKSTKRTRSTKSTERKRSTKSTKRTIPKQFLQIVDKAKRKTK